MKQDILEILQGIVPELVDETMIEEPTYAHLGDYAFPCFSLAKVLKKSPVLIAEEIAQRINDPRVQTAEAVNGYVNFFMNKPYFSQHILETIINQSNQYGSSQIGQGSVVIIDISSYFIRLHD